MRVRYIDDRDHSWEYRDYINSGEWAWKTQRLKSEALYHCQACGHYLPTGLQCHHLTYHRLRDEGPWDIMVLCPPCHEQADEVRRADLADPADRNSWIREERRKDRSLSWDEARFRWVIDQLSW